MSRRVPFFLAGTTLAVALTAGLAWAPAATAAQQRATVYMDTMAWYQETPPCVSLGVDCSALPPAAPYSEDTLHVSISTGQETARTDLAFLLPSGGNLTAGQLTLPVDADPQDGSVSPDQAAITACLVTETFRPVRGSLESPPKTNCHVSSDATYQAKQATFTIDLAPFLAKWSGTQAALALIPSNEAKQSQATWHVVFHATQKPSKDAPPITATLSYASSSSSSTTAPPVSSGTSQGSSSTSSQPVSGGPSSFGGPVGGFSGFPSTSTTTTQTTTTTVSGGTTQTPTTMLAPASLEGFAGPGFAYPLVWALPLVFLAVLAAIGHALTKELYRRGV